ncbi:MAG: acyl carrier protein [Candidatus Azotimanducaceae bacterium]|jgi:acyl carrier protein
MKKEELFAFICDDADLDPTEINDDTPLFSDGYIDSFTLTSVIAFVEEQGGFRIEQSAVTLENFDTISNIMLFYGRQDVS